MMIKKIELNKILENSWNPNFMQDSTFKILINHIKKSGMKQPILVRPIKNNLFEIIDGAHRTRASKEAGLKEIDCVILNLTDSQAKATTIAMNSIKGNLDDISLAKLMSEIKSNFEGNLSEETGLKEEKIKDLLNFIELDDSSLPKIKKQSRSISFSLPEKNMNIVLEALEAANPNDKNSAILFLSKAFLNLK